MFIIVKILSDIDRSVIRILMITFLLYKSAFPSLYFRNIVAAYNNIVENLRKIFYLSNMAKFILFTDVFTDGLYDPFRTHDYMTRDAKAVKMPMKSSARAGLFRETQTIRCSLTNRAKPQQ